MDPELESRLSQMETRIQSLEAALLVQQDLGGQLIEREEVVQMDEEVVVVDRSHTSALATFNVPVLLDRKFRPSMYGYTAEDFARDYPDVKPDVVLESFFSHHLGKGDKSKNWLEKFWSYAARAQQIEREKRMSNPVETDSMGLPTDRKARNEMLGK